MAVANPLASEAVLTELDAAREQTLALIADCDDALLERRHSPLMSPLVWDLGHIAAYEDLWLCHRHGGLPLLRPDLAELYDAFETPRAARAADACPGRAESLAYLADVRERVREVVGNGDGGGGDGESIATLVARHERQHHETMLQTLNLAWPEHWSPPGIVGAPARQRAAWPSGGELVAVAAGEFVLGAAHDGFAYDNERPAHTIDLPAFQIGRTAVTNGDWLSFVEAGGYERRELWSEAGWDWRRSEAVGAPLNWLAGPHGSWRERRLGGEQPLDHSRPVVHVSWFEADAFARSRGLRLPTEAEWEKAATWDAAGGQKRSFPWGKSEPRGDRANLLEGRLYGTAAADAHPGGAAPCGALGMIGDVWEWTASWFGGYEGFVAHPYPEYSEVFFGERYRVLRGGSWATSAHVVSPTFRNWDHPQRRQIFAGVRLACDG